MAVIIYADMVYTHDNLYADGLAEAVVPVGGLFDGFRCRFIRSFDDSWAVRLDDNLCLQGEWSLMFGCVA